MSNITLRIGYPDGRSETRELEHGSYRIGRESADLVLSHASVSAHHASLQVQPGRVVIQDAGSRNGTFDPAGQRLTAPYELVPEQPIRLGAISLTLLRAVGQAGGTRVMAEVPPIALPRAVALPPMAPPPTHAPPPLSRWLKLAGAFAVLLLGFVSLQTCGALVQAIGGR